MVEPLQLQTGRMGPQHNARALHYSFNWVRRKLARIYPMFFGYLVAVIFSEYCGGCSLPKYESRQSKRMESRLGNAGLGCIHEVPSPWWNSTEECSPRYVGVWALAVRLFLCVVAAVIAYDLFPCRRVSGNG